MGNSPATPFVKLLPFEVSGKTFALLQSGTCVCLDNSTAVVGVIDCTGPISFDHSELGRVLGAVQHIPAAKTLAVVLCKDEQHERVDAAVGVAEADTDVVGVDKGNSWRVVAQVDHLNDMVGRPTDQEQRDDHQDHLGGSFCPNRLLALHPPDGAEDVVEGERVEGADDDERDYVAQDGLVESVPVHVLGPIQVHHAHLHVLPALDLGVHHDGDGEEEATQPHQHVDHDSPVDGPLL